MRAHWKRFLMMFCLSWITAAAMVTLSLGRYAAEDFSLQDLMPIYLILTVFGPPLTAIFALPALLFLRGRLRSNPFALIHPFVSALFVAAVPAATSLVGAFVFKSLPAGEALLFTGAFAVMGLTFGLAFLQLYGEAWARRWWATLACLLIAVCATVAITTLIPFVKEAFLASAGNGSVTRAVAMSEGPSKKL